MNFKKRSDMRKTGLLAVLALLLLGLFLVRCDHTKQAAPAGAKYVFLFIGDGMGLSQVVAAEAFLTDLSPGGGYVSLPFRDFPVNGLSNTYAANRFITGSAAAGTALATGHKTSVGRISMDTSGSIPLQTLAEKAMEKGMRTGIISNVSIDHATPAAFYAHQPSRNMYFEIGLDLARSGIDFFGGGGFKEPDGSLNGREVYIPALAQENGYTYINDVEAFLALEAPAGKVLFVHPGLTAGASMFYAIDQPEGYFSLAGITRKAIELLEGDEGFFIMVEGGKIDWLCHDNDAGATVWEVLDFSAAIDEAIRFYERYPEETLIVVTADHETGGLGLGSNVMKYDTDYALLAHQKVSGEAFNRILAGWLPDNHINEKGFKKLLMLTEEYFGLGGEGAPIVLSTVETGRLRQAFMGLEVSREGEDIPYDRLTLIILEILSHRAGLAWTTLSHTGTAVPVYALGVNSMLFGGQTENTDIPLLIWQTIE